MSRTDGEDSTYSAEPPWILADCYCQPMPAPSSITPKPRRYKISSGMKSKPAVSRCSLSQTAKSRFPEDGAFGSMIRKPTTYRESATSHPGSRRRTITETSGSEVSTGDCTNTTGMVLRLFTTTPNSPFLMPSTPLRSAHCSRIVPGCFGSERSAAA